MENFLTNYFLELKTEADKRIKELEAENKQLTLTLTSITMPPNAAQVAVQRLRAEDAEAELAAEKRLCDSAVAKMEEVQAELVVVKSQNYNTVERIKGYEVELAALRNELAALKCCGNCKHSEYDGSYFDCEWQPRGEDEWDDLAYPSLKLCCYSPSRWKARP